MGEVAGTEGDTMCPQGREQCVANCKPDSNDSISQSGCVQRCINYCQDPKDMSDFNACPEGKPRCEKACEDMSGINDGQRTGCKARCVNSCCPKGIVDCKEQC